MSTDTPVQVGDWLLLTHIRSKATRYVKILRETHTQWVCTGHLRVIKGQRSLGFTDHSVTRVSGVPAAIHMTIETEDAANAVAVFADFLESAGNLEQANELRASIEAFNEFVGPREATSVPPKWFEAHRYNFRAPRGFEYIYEFRTVDATIGVVMAGQNPQGDWLWSAQIPDTDNTLRQLGFFTTVSDAKTAVRKYWKDNPTPTSSPESNPT